MHIVKKETIPKYYQEKSKKILTEASNISLPPNEIKEEKGKKNILRFSFPFFPPFFAGVILDLGTKKKERRVFFPHFLIKLFSSGKGKKKEGKWFGGEKRAERKGNNYICVHLHKKSIMGLEKKEGEEGLNPSSVFLLLLFLFLFLEKKGKGYRNPTCRKRKKEKFFFRFPGCIYAKVLCVFYCIIPFGENHYTTKGHYQREDTKHFQLKPSLSP